MATTTVGGSGSDFTSNLGRIYTIYTGGFIAFIVLMAILSAVGVPNRVIGYLFMGFTIVIYAVIGILSRTMQVGEYYVAGRRVLVRDVGGLGPGRHTTTLSLGGQLRAGVYFLRLSQSGKTATRRTVIVR